MKMRDSLEQMDQQQETNKCQTGPLPQNFNEIFDRIVTSDQEHVRINEENICHWYRLAEKILRNSTSQAGWCPHGYDDLLFWPATAPNTTAVLQCPDTLYGIKYDTSNTTTRYCSSNGSWMTADYDGCTPAYTDIELPIPWIHLQIMYYIYWIGYSISLIFLFLAIAVVARYRKLWCLRNVIHCNLIACFAFHNLTWILYSLVIHEILTKYYGLEEIAYCYIPTTIMKYFITASFFWMFIEGLYLLMSVAFSFHSQRLQFWICAIVGWVVPLFLIAATTIAKVKGYPSEECWNEQYYLDYIFIGPVLCILLLNVIFLIIIMYVVVTKLQVTVPAEATRYRKAIKALFILCPLLGVNYIFVLVQPSHPLWARLVFSYYFAIMTSLQGSLVAILFCFRNNEIWQTIKRSTRKCSRSKGVYSDGSHRMRRSMRIDTQSSMMIDFEPSSGACHWRRHMSSEARVANGLNRCKLPTKRSSNVIIMRDDGELRRFLPQSASNERRKLTAPAGIALHGSVKQPSKQHCEEKIDRERYSLPVLADSKPTTSPSMARTSSPNDRSRQIDHPMGRRSVSNYRPVKGRTRVRYAYSGDRTSAF